MPFHKVTLIANDSNRLSDNNKFCKNIVSYTVKGEGGPAFGFAALDYRRRRTRREKTCSEIPARRLLEGRHKGAESRPGLQDSFFISYFL
jgi:hypothetical protein